MHLAQEANTGFLFLAPWLVFAPLVGLLINLIFGKWFSEGMIGFVASLASGVAFIVSLLLTYSLSVNHGEAMRWFLAEWIHIGELHLDWTFRVDSLSTTMMLVVSGVGTLIHIYAIGYMHEDVRFKNDTARFRRFFLYLNLFIAMMMILVSGDSYLMLFVGWEGVGLCSFLLIGFWYEMDIWGRPSHANANAAKKAFVVNRVGDFGFLIAAFLMFWYLGNSFQFDHVFEAAKEAPPGIIVAITLFILVGVAGKSAQIPLYVWLPDAMAGPTPVSALIHAATMVTAGVYLITRSAELYLLAPQAQYIVALTGAITALFAATIAVGQYDIKKVLAYSTISQLGFMVAAVGMGAFVAGMFHLVTHAFFKALLFLSAGSVILGVERGHHHAEHAHHVVRVLLIVKLFEQLLARGGGPHRSRSHSEEVRHVDLPPRILAQEACVDRRVGRHKHVRPAHAADLTGREGNVRQTRRADLGQRQPGPQAPHDLHAEVDDRRPFDFIAELDAQFLGREQRLLHEVPGQFIQRRFEVVLHRCSCCAARRFALAEPVAIEAQHGTRLPRFTRTGNARFPRHNVNCRVRE